MQTREEIDQEKYFSPISLERKEEIMKKLFCYSKIKSHFDNCSESKKENLSSENLPDCDICNKILCFLHHILKKEFEMNSVFYKNTEVKSFIAKVNIRGLILSGSVDYMIFGPGIKLME